ncbi:SAM-dependent methyltransferase [Nocardia vaccinii]|uniref:SAM-dependent methyltransferase n=1 Tax=Nocardia vaccinii TaxID=1822 RepID=UPI0009FD64F2
MPDGDSARRLPTTIDTAVAHEARVYDYWLGDFDIAGADRAAQAGGRGGLTLVARNRTEVERLFAGTDLVPPGITTMEDWHPEPGEHLPRDADPHLGHAWAWAGMGWGANPERSSPRNRAPAVLGCVRVVQRRRPVRGVRRSNAAGPGRQQ